MNQFLERHKLPKHTQGETDNLNSLLSTKEIAFIAKTFQHRKLQAQVVSLANI